MIYLASPYYHKDPAIMAQRFEAACFHAGAMMQSGLIVYSPIVHCHPIAIRCELGKGWDFWKKFDLGILRHCEKLWVLQLDGWKKSPGCKAEIAFAEEAGIPVTYVDPLQWL